MAKVANKKVWLTPKGRKKTGLACIQATDQKIEVKGPYVRVTSSDTDKTYQRAFVDAQYEL
jgi:hypothetical protein